MFVQFFLVECESLSEILATLSFVKHNSCKLGEGRTLLALFTHDSAEIFSLRANVNNIYKPPYKQTRTDLNSLKDLFVRIYA